MQDGGCFDLLHGGTPDDPTSWLAADATVPFEHWFWPLAATIPGDGTVRIFLAELEERGPRYLANATPLATWVATLDATTLAPVAFGPAPDPGPALYGWSVASDTHFTYLYGHCYRQFGFGFLGHDGCTSAVTVARTTHDLQRPLQYWDGSRWSADPNTSVNIAPKLAHDGSPRSINPTQFAHIGGRWIAVTKDGDWWGSKIYLDTAPGPTGPWTTTATLDATAPQTRTRTRTSPASLPPTMATDTWSSDSATTDGTADRTSQYRPTFQTVPLNRWDQPTTPDRAAFTPNVRYR